MKALLLILMSLVLVNCGNKKFTSNNPSNDPGNPIVDIDDHDDDNNCPRYDLVVKSTHTTTQKLNFKYTFNAEMTETAVQGEHKILFTKSQYAPCSGNYVNASLFSSLIPLQDTEDLTGEVMLTNGAACVSSARETTIEVIDSATNTVLFSEADLRAEHGCEFGYTDDGNALRAQLINLADAVANAKGNACN